MRFEEDKDPAHVVFLALFIVTNFSSGITLLDLRILLDFLEGEVTENCLKLKVMLYYIVFGNFSVSQSVIKLCRNEIIGVLINKSYTIIYISSTKILQKFLPWEKATKNLFSCFNNSNQRSWIYWTFKGTINISNIKAVRWFLWFYHRILISIYPKYSWNSIKQCRKSVILST